MFFSKPDISKLEKSRNINSLIKALHYKKSWSVRDDAAKALGRLKDPAAIPALIEVMSGDGESIVRRSCANNLESVGFHPQKDAIGAVYWSTRNHFQECADCGSEHAISLLLHSFVTMDNRTDMESSWKDAYLSMGQAGLMPLISLADQIYEQYKSFISNIRGLDFRSAEDTNKAAIIKRISGKLCVAADAIGEYRNRKAFLFIQHFYNKVQKEIYSVPDGGFSDMYNAVDIRSNTVCGLKSFSEDMFDEIGGFLADVLINDQSYSVRWKAVDVLHRWPLERVLNDTELQNALRKALESEPDSISSRKSYILAMLGETK